MSGIVYPSGAQLLRIPTTILLPSTATAFNPSAINPSVEQCWDSIKALESYGIFKSTFVGAQPPYTPGTSFVNSGTYKFGTTSQTKLEFSAAKTYTRAASPLALYKSTTWYPSVNATPPKAYYRQDSAVVASADDALVFFFELPTLCTLKYLKFWIDPVDTHVAVPGSIPKVDVYIGDNTVIGDATLIVSADGYEGTGTYADVAQYQAPHMIIADLASTAFDAGVNTVFARIYGEGTTNQENNLLVSIPWIEFERTKIGEEFGALVP